MQPSEYLVSDLRWSDPLENAADDDGRFSVAHLPPPQGWLRGLSDGWVIWQPESVELPGQGWKVHISARPDEADEVIRLVSDYCFSQNVAFKFLRSRLVYLVRNEKYAPRGGSGKLLTLYPVSDAQLAQVLRELSDVLIGRTGPYILSDLRWGRGPLYLRYGGFRLSYCVCPQTGEFVPALREPGGSLLPDLRNPVFVVPSWVQIPDFVAAEIAATSAQAAGNLPYRVEEVLHFSNGGGIYRAVDPVTNRTVVLREARPHAGLDAHETDAVSRIATECAILERLAGLDVVPALLDQFTCWEHHFLVEEFIEGTLLQHAIGERYPLIYPNPSVSELAGYVSWAMAVLTEIERALDAVHSRGVVFADLHPFNVILRPDGRVALVDFEESFDISERRGSGLGAPGFVPPWPVTGVDVDEYALTCLRLYFFLPLTQLLALDPSKAPDLVQTAAARFGLPQDFRDRLVQGLSPPDDWEESNWRARRPGLYRAATAIGSRPDERPVWARSAGVDVLDDSRDYRQRDP